MARITWHLSGRRGGCKCRGYRKMDAKKTIDYSNLKEKLAELDARSFQRAERACRMSADATPDITYSSAFRARLAA